jgi:polyhydroxyalkanoate synthesis regulator phasin
MDQQKAVARQPTTLERTLALLERLASTNADDWVARGRIAMEARKILDELRQPPQRENGA